MFDVLDTLWCFFCVCVCACVCFVVQECSALKPSMLDFMQRKGRVLKKMGAVSKAAEVVNAARLLDKADRYMNSKVFGNWLSRHLHLSLHQEKFTRCSASEARCRVFAPDSTP